MAGVSAGAPFVLLDGAVVAAGLAHEFAGLPLNWRIGPSGKDFGPPYFVGMTATGGMRSQLPLSPVHLHLAPRGGDLDLSWIRRGRLDADSWLGEDIPLAEQAERYRIIVATAGGAVRRTVDVDTPRWTYMAAWLAADFPSRPATVAVGVSQVSLAAGEGPPARRSFTLA
jgi:hypothetical protein